MGPIIHSKSCRAWRRLLRGSYGVSVDARIFEVRAWEETDKVNYRAGFPCLQPEWLMFVPMLTLLSRDKMNYAFSIQSEEDALWLEQHLMTSNHYNSEKLEFIHEHIKDKESLMEEAILYFVNKTCEHKIDVILFRGLLSLMPPREELLSIIIVPRMNIDKLITGYDSSEVMLKTLR